MAARRFKRTRRFKRRGGRAFTGKVRAAITRIAEKKFCDVQMHWTPSLNEAPFLGWQLVKDGATSSAQALVPLNTVDEGTDDTQRVGKKTMARYLSLKIVCAMYPGTATDLVPFATAFPMGLSLKFVVVLDQEPNTTQAAASDIWDEATGTQAYVAQRNRRKSTRFRVLAEDIMTMSPQVMCPCTISRFISLRNLVTAYANTGFSINNIMTNAIQLWVCPNVSASTVGSDQDTKYSFSLTGEFRAVYVDV